MATNLAKNLPITPAKFNSDTTKVCFTDIFNNKRNKFQLFNISAAYAVIKKFCLAYTWIRHARMNQIPAKFVKEAADVLAYSLSNIINWSIKLSVFPQECKISRLKSLFKKDSKTDLKNYKPILLQPIASKSTEKSMHSQLRDYLKKNDRLYKYQSDFKTNFSTDWCLV